MRAKNGPFESESVGTTGRNAVLRASWRVCVLGQDGSVVPSADVSARPLASAIAPEFHAISASRVLLRPVPPGAGPRFRALHARVRKPDVDADDDVAVCQSAQGAGRVCWTRLDRCC